MTASRPVRVVSSECLMPRDFTDSHAACMIRDCQCRCHERADAAAPAVSRG